MSATLQHLALLLGKAGGGATLGAPRQGARRRTSSAICGEAKDGVFADYDFIRRQASTYAYISSLYPLWAGVATREQAKQMVAKLNLFERPGGLSMSNFNSGMQWDEPFGWAPTNWIADRRPRRRAAIAQ